MDVIWPPEFANAGWAMDLTSRFPVQEQKKFLAGPIAANTYKDRIFGVPCYLAAGLFYYRKDLLNIYHYKPPQTWDEMLSQGRTMVRGEGDPSLHIYSGQFKQYEGLVCNMMEFIWSNGGSIIDWKTGRAVLDQLAAVEAVRFVRDRIVAEAAPRGVINYEEPESLDFFLQGKAVFHRNWPYAWAMAHDAQRSKIAGKIGVGPLPSFKNHGSSSTLGGWQFAVNRYSNQPEAARRFIEFMTSHQTQKRLALAAGLAPTRRSVYQDPEVLKRMPHLQAFLPAFKRARPRPLSPVYPMISQELQRYFSKAIVNKGSDLSGLARKAHTKIQRLLELESMIRR
jgi:multiple sugar transport system substrate-binding protein